MAKKTLVFVLSLLLSFSVFATDKTPAFTSFELNATGKINDCPVYQLRLKNSKNISFQIVIKDEFGCVLYEEFVASKEVVRNYMIDVNELGNTRISIEVMDASGLVLKKFSGLSDK
jgi:hypothetical protein